MGGAAPPLTFVALMLLLTSTSNAMIEFIVEPEDVSVAVGNDARFDCTYTTTDSSPTSLSWLHNGSALVSDSRYSVLSNGSLEISNIESGDQGQYTCRVTNTLTQLTEERNASLSIASIVDSFLLSPDSTSVNEGGSLLLFCVNGGSEPPAIITWTLETDTVEQSERISINSVQLEGTNPTQTSSSLYISSVQPGDEGSYTCWARNRLLPDTIVASSAGYVTVIGLPRSPTITQGPSNTTVVSGSGASLSCSADGIPVPSFTWFHDDTLLSPGGDVAVTSQGEMSTLSLSNVDDEDEGEYHCQADNGLGTASSDTAQLTLAFLDTVFQQSPGNTLTTAGTTTQLDCLPPPSNPMAIISWSKDYSNLPVERFSVLANGSLLISSTTLEDQAVYHCLATNPLLGTTATSDPANLTVVSIPEIAPESISVSVGQSTTFLCEASGSPAPSLTWYNGTREITADTPRTLLTLNTLTISNIEREDQGEWVCIATYPSGMTRGSAMLWVNGPPLFLNPSISTTVIEGQDVTLPCAVLPDPTLSFSWSFNDIPISLPSNEEEGPVLYSNGSLYLPAVDASDHDGTYTCLASNNLGTAEGTVSLTVFVPPTVTISSSSSSLIVTAGEGVVLTCTASGNPDPVISWYHIDSLLLETGVSVVLEEVEREDEGVYECVAVNLAGSDRDNVTLTVHTHPVVEVSPSLLILQVGSTANFTCTSSGNPAPIITWYNEFGSDVTTLGDDRIRVEGGTLVISDIISSDGQDYTCTASNDVGSSSSSVHLNVLVPPAVSLPSFMVGVQGDPFTLDCNPSGNPSPSVSWFKNNQLLLTENNDRITVDQRITISSLYSTDIGNYSCLATSNLGTATANTILTVLVIPVIHGDVSVVMVTVGNTAVLECNATGNPLPEVTWFRSSQPVLQRNESSRIRVTSDNGLVVEETRESDEGEYVCQAVNVAGSETVHLQLLVHDPPTITQSPASQTVHLHSPVFFHCTAMGDPDPIITWNFQGSPISGVQGGNLTVPSAEAVNVGTYSCVASNLVGVATADASLIVLFPPSSPTLTQATATSSTTILLQWTASPDNGGSLLTNYIIEYRLSGETEFSSSTITDPDTLTTTISGLSPYQEYDVRVRGENEVGSGDPSNSLSTETHPDAPSAPRQFRVVSSTSSSISLSWSPPEPANGVIVAYQLEHGPEETFDLSRQIQFLLGTGYTLEGLESEVTYLLRVRASTTSIDLEFLWGPYALLRVQDGVTLEIPTPPPPSPSPSPSLSTSSSLPPFSSPSSVVASSSQQSSGLLSTQNSEDTSSTSMTTPPSSSSSFSMSSQMVAPSSSKQRLPSSSLIQPSSTPTSPSTPPSSSLPSSAISSSPSPSPPTPPPTSPPPPIVTPRDLSLSVTIIGTITISWRPPLTELDTIEGYAVIVSPPPPSSSSSSSSPSLLPHNPSLTAYNLTISNLTSFTKYTITVATYNSGGLGPLSLTAMITTLESIPTAPQNVSVIHLPDNNLLVTWLPPATPNGIITSYTVMVQVNSTGREVLSHLQEVTDSTHLVTQSVSLSTRQLSLDSVQYQVLVSATNGAGTGPSSHPVFIGSSDIPSVTDAPTEDYRDSDYYSVRILPPIVGVALILVVMVTMMVVWWYYRSYRVRMMRKGIYKFSGTETGSNFELKTRFSDGGVARDDLETSMYYVRDALDANITYSAGPQVQTVDEREEGRHGWGDEEEDEEEEEDVDTPYLGEYLTGEEEGEGEEEEDLLIEGRDALEESPSHAPSERPESLEFPSLPRTHLIPPSPSHPLNRPHLQRETGGGGGGGSLTSSQNSLSNYHPGDHTYAELDEIRAKKVQLRAKRFKDTNNESTGYSSGGLMETRIGTIGGGGGGGGGRGGGGRGGKRKESPLVSNGHITPGELAHMY